MCKAIDRITCPKSLQQGQIDERRDLIRRLENPKFHELEHQLGEFPDQLKQLYTQTDLLVQENFVFVGPDNSDRYIMTFLPADLKTVNDCWFQIGDKHFPFAEDDFGNYYFVEIKQEKSSLCPVYFISHDGDGRSVNIAESLREFITRPIKKV